MLLFFSLLTMGSITFMFSQNSIDDYLNGNNNHVIIGGFEDGIDKPRDLDFHPLIQNQLWVLNQGDERYLNNSENILTVCIEENSDVVFTIYDSHGDGICCESGEGFYSISVCDEIYASGGDFESEESFSFNVGENCQNTCEMGEIELTVTIFTDDWAKEISWSLIDYSTQEVYARRLEPGGSTVIFHNAGLDNQISEYRKDSYSRHFMNTASAFAFDNQGFFANTLECQDANNNINGYFTGPTLWDSDLSIYAVFNQDGPLLGSHLDMIHQSPYSMGIDYGGIGNVYWVFDGYHSSIVRYDFALPHEIGGHDHSDGKVWRYDEVDIQRSEGIPSHMVLDDVSGYLYVADTGNQRILKFDTNSGNFSYDLTPYGESLAEYWMMENAHWEIFIDENLIKPSGIDLFNNRLVVSDYATGQIIFYDISTDLPSELGRIETGYEDSIMGIKIDQNQKLWYVNFQNNNVVLVKNNIISGDINGDSFVNVTDVVLLVDFILNSSPEASNLFLDINNDGIVNIVDVVQLVTLILDNE